VVFVLVNLMQFQLGCKLATMSADELGALLVL